MTRDIIVADASCLIILQNIGELSLLQKIFGEITVTEEVKNEFYLPLPEWIKIRSASDSSKAESLTLILDKGEASSIALCLESPNALLIIDEKKGRRIARELNIATIGTFGLILRAKELGLINSIEALVAQMEDAGFYLSKTLKEKLTK